MVRVPLVRFNGLQAVCLPTEVAFPEAVKSVSVMHDGKCLLIVPADAVWDDFFEAPGIPLDDRAQPALQDKQPDLF